MRWRAENAACDKSNYAETGKCADDESQRVETPQGRVAELKRISPVGPLCSIVDE